MLEEFLENWRRGSRGPLPQLTPLQLLNALILIEREGPMGRRALAHSLQLKDGVIRGLTERLAETKLVSVGDSGVQLSAPGRKSLQKLFRRLSIKKIMPLEGSDLILNGKAVGIHLSHAYRGGMTGVEQRDAAVKAGAEGSITVAAISGKLTIPPDNRDLARVAPKENARLKDEFNPSNQDLVVIGFGGDTVTATAGALAAALSLRKE
jgi:hypothetical protein